MSRHQKKAFEYFLNNATKTQLMCVGIHAGVRAWNRGVIGRILRVAETIGLSHEKQVHAIVQWHHRQHYKKKSAFTDELKRDKASLYIGLEHFDSGDRPVFRIVEVPHYFVARLKQVNEEKEARDRAAVDLRERINAVRTRVYSSRTFPVTLRGIIFERDNYTCQVCLRDRAKLLAAGLHLECDHILAWEDGGMTTYDNGQTVCSECNKAKHHSKVYLGLVARLKAP